MMVMWVASVFFANLSEPSSAVCALPNFYSATGAKIFLEKFLCSDDFWYVNAAGHR
jgi:hypothetical protein